MGSKTNCCGVFGFILTLISLGLLGASIGTTYWRTPGGDSLNSILTLQALDNTFGLFEICTNVGRFRTCNEIGWSPTEAGIVVTVTRALLLFAAILIVIGLIVGLASFCGSANIKSQGVLNILGGLSVLVACATYLAMTVLVSREVSNPPAVTDYGYSFYVCWVTGGLFLIAGIFGLKGNGKQHNENEVSPEQTQMVWATNAQPRADFISPIRQQQLALVNA